MAIPQRVCIYGTWRCGREAWVCVMEMFWMWRCVQGVKTFAWGPFPFYLEKCVIFNFYAFWKISSCFTRVATHSNTFWPGVHKLLRNTACWKTVLTSLTWRILTTIRVRKMQELNCSWWLELCGWAELTLSPDHHSACVTLAWDAARAAGSNGCRQHSRTHCTFLEQWHLLLKCTFYMKKSHK